MKSNKKRTNEIDLEQSVHTVIEALDLRYVLWRKSAIKGDYMDEIILAMDETHEKVINYLKGMLLSPKPIDSDDAV